MIGLLVGVTTTRGLFYAQILLKSIRKIPLTNPELSPILRKLKKRKRLVNKKSPIPHRLGVFFRLPSEFRLFDFISRAWLLLGSSFMDSPDTKTFLASSDTNSSFVSKNRYKPWNCSHASHVVIVWALLQNGAQVSRGTAESWVRRLAHMSRRKEI